MKIVVLVGAVILALLASSSASSSSGDSGFIDEQNIMSVGGDVSTANSVEIDGYSGGGGVVSAIESLLVNSGNRKMVVMMLSGAQPNCIPTGQPCGMLHPCCPNNFCTDLIQGICTYSPCIPKGQPCGLLHKCCNGMCPDLIQGTCTS